MRTETFDEGSLASFEIDAPPPARDYPPHSFDRAAGAPPPRVEIFPAEAVHRRAAQWRGIAAEIVQSTSRANVELRFRAPVHLLIVYEQGARLNGETAVEGQPHSRLRDFTRRFTFVPAGRQFRETHEPRARSAMLLIYLDPATFAADAASLAPRLFFEDAALWDSALKLKGLVETSNGEDEDSAYGEALGAVLRHELVRVHRQGPGRALPVRGGLAAWQQRVVAAYVEEHLAEPIALADLARLVRLSPFHFCRAFKQSFGIPPHRYHTSRRIERAKTMLSRPDYSVTDIGLTVGFSETSSFSAAFRRATGTTPKGYHRRLA